MSTYIFAPNGEIEKRGPRPRWLGDDGKPVSDAVLADHGWFLPLPAEPVPEGKVVTASEPQLVAGVWQWVNTLEDAPPPPAPEVISDRQFAQQLAVLEVITEAEAIAWAARGELPDAMETAVAALPEGEQFPARMLLSSATTYERSHPLVPMLGAILSYDAAELDDLWRAAAGL